MFPNWLVPPMYGIIRASKLSSSGHRPIDAMTLAERRGVMVLSWQRGAHARRKQTWETFAMDPWIASGCFLLGAGAGSLVSAALHAKEIRKLKNVLEAARNNPKQKTKTNVPSRTGASPPDE
jgi:hypothetical protein